MPNAQVTNETVMIICKPCVLPLKFQFNLLKSYSKNIFDKLIVTALAVLAVVKYATAALECLLAGLVYAFAILATSCIVKTSVHYYFDLKFFIYFNNF